MRRALPTDTTPPQPPKTPPLSKQELSEAERKRSEAERLRAAEKFMVIGSGTAACKGCGYEYSPDKGDPDFPVPRGVTFQELPSDYCCPICGAPKERFESRVRTIAGFAENQQYGLGTNSMTGNQKLLLIYGAFLFFCLVVVFVQIVCLRGTQACASRLLSSAPLTTNPTQHKTKKTNTLGALALFFILFLGGYALE